MKTPLIITYFVLALLSSCDNSAKKMQNEKTASSIDKLQQDSLKTINPLEEALKTIPENITPVLSYRFIISGDFDGDGNKEKLIEHFFSRISHRETNKFYEGLSDYDQLVALTLKKEPYSFVISDNQLIDTLHISSEGQLLGLSFLKNEGDLNGDGTDEISYVVNWADRSNTNTWYVVTYKNKKWTELYSFPIWDWQLPDLPETFNQYGLFGLEDKAINTTHDTINKRREDEAEEDTMIVDLSRLK